MIRCPSAACKSVNVVDLPHYWQSLPNESPLKTRYAPPDVPGTGGCLAALATTAVGVFIMVRSDAIWTGLLIAATGLLAGLLIRHNIQRAEAQLNEWNNLLLCLACTGKF